MSEKKVYLWDHTFVLNRGSNWDRALAASFESSYVSPVVDGANRPPSDHPAYDGANCLLFVHTGLREQWLAKAADVSCHIVLVRGEGGGGRCSNKRGNLHGCRWSPTTFRAPGGRVARFIEQFKERDLAAVDWNLLQPGSDGAEALSIFCQGLLRLATQVGLDGAQDFWNANERLRRSVLEALERDKGQGGAVPPEILGFLNSDRITEEAVRAAIATLGGMHAD